MFGPLDPSVLAMLFLYWCKTNCKSVTLQHLNLNWQHSCIYPGYTVPLVGKILPKAFGNFTMQRI